MYITEKREKEGGGDKRKEKKVFSSFLKKQKKTDFQRRDAFFGSRVYYMIVHEEGWSIQVLNEIVITVLSTIVSRS